MISRDLIGRPVILMASDGTIMKMLITSIDYDLNVQEYSHQHGQVQIAGQPTLTVIGNIIPD